mmetsp:Transcript_7822/g.13409  ORF Transcript_7822/g.13409 Transcript_7822/m.13409 type:complete len:347 (-) Transcript_7822:832-1872(-)
MHGLDELEPSELVLPRDPVQLRQDGLADEVVVAHVVDVVAGDVVASRQLLDLVDLGHHHRHKEVLETVAVYPQLLHVSRLQVHVLQRLGRDVLALGKLEDVLLAVDDADGAVLVHLGDVASAEPPVGREGLSGLLGQVVVPREHVRPAHPDLPSPARRVRPPVVHLSHVDELDLGAAGGVADRARLVVLHWRHQTGRSRFGEAVPLHDAAPEDSLEELDDVGRHGSATHCHDAEPAAHKGRDAPHDGQVPELGAIGGVAVGLLDVVHLGAEGVGEDGADEEVHAVHRRRDLLVHAAVHSRDGGHGGRFQGRNVIEELADVTLVESHGPAEHQAQAVDDDLEGVGEG